MIFLLLFTGLVTASVVFVFLINATGGSASTNDGNDMVATPGIGALWRQQLAL